MSAPGQDHEARAALLDACALLTGHTARTRLSLRDVPDVVRTDPARARLFVGDAKDTETPGCAATARRLGSYARSAAAWSSAGWSVRLALCHGHAHHALGWSALLSGAARRAGLVPQAGGTIALGDGSQLTWVDLGPLSTTRPQFPAACSTTPRGPANVR